MTALDLPAIQARVDAARPGPWHAHPRMPGTADIRTADDWWINDECKDLFTDTDAEFIAAARTDVPALLAEVARLTAARDAALALHPKVNTRTGQSCGRCMEVDTYDGTWPCADVVALTPKES